MAFNAFCTVAPVILGHQARCDDLLDGRLLLESRVERAEAF